MLAAFEVNTLPLWRDGMAAFEVVITPTAKMAMPTGHRQDSFVRGACDPDLSGALGPLWLRISVQLSSVLFSRYLSLPE